MIKSAALLIATAALSGCATSADLNYCSGSDIRRSVYERTIEAAHFAEAIGRITPADAELMRGAAVVALTALNRRCPIPAPASAPL